MCIITPSQTSRKSLRIWSPNQNLLWWPDVFYNASSICVKQRNLQRIGRCLRSWGLICATLICMNNAGCNSWCRLYLDKAYSYHQSRAKLVVITVHVYLKWLFWELDTQHHNEGNQGIQKNIKLFWQMPVGRCSLDSIFQLKILSQLLGHLSLAT